jgi:flagellar protein FliL
VADEEKTSDEGTTEAAPPKGKSSLKLMLILIASLAVGGSVGFLAIGPVVGSKMAAPAGDAGEHGSEGKDKKAKGGGHGGGAEAESPLYNIENLVVNPAGTQGTRFLVVSIAIQITDGGDAAVLKERDPEVRDVLLHLLSSKSIDQLSNLVSRDSLKADIRLAVEGVIGEGTVAKVFVPQFVLQ